MPPIPPNPPRPSKPAGTCWVVLDSWVEEEPPEREAFY